MAKFSFKRLADTRYPRKTVRHGLGKRLRRWIVGPTNLREKDGPEPSVRDFRPKRQRSSHNGRRHLTYSHFRRYSKTTYPSNAEMAAIPKFTPVKISFSAKARVFPCPLATVNSPIKRFE